MAAASSPSEHLPDSPPDSLLRSLSAQYGPGASQYDEASLKSWKQYAEAGMQAMKGKNYQRAVEGLTEATKLRLGFAKVENTLRLAEKRLAEEAEAQEALAEDAHQEEVEVEFLRGEELISWALSQKAPSEKERIAVSKITPELFLGSRYGIVEPAGKKEGAETNTLVLESLMERIIMLSGFELGGIVNVAAIDPRAHYVLPEDSGIAYHGIEIDDQPDARLTPFLDAATEFIHRELSKPGGKGCFVHCMGGYSRSASVVIAYLIRYRGLTYDDAFKVCKRGRPQTKPNEGFEKQLREWEGKWR